MAVTEDERRFVTLPALRASERSLAAVVDALEPDDVALTDVTDVWQAFDRIERLAANAKTLLAARVEAAGAWKRSGARSAAEHLASLSGTTTSAARRTIETSKQVGALREISDALRGGVLSAMQVDAIAGAAWADPAAERRLLVMAHSTNVTELREECLRTRAAADPDRESTYRRIHERRVLRTYTDAEGARNLVVRGPADQVARIEVRLEPLIDKIFAEARTDGRREGREAYAFDALVALADLDEAAPAPKKPSRVHPRYLALLHVDVEALTRGATEADERCEIVGVGPVPVRVAREVLGESIVKLVLTRGVDVANVVHLGQGPTMAQRIALLWSKPKCANVECSSMFVQIDHRKEWAVTKHTRLDELDPLCPHHHNLKTTQGWSLVDGVGRRAFVGPNDPRHPRYRPPP